MKPYPCFPIWDNLVQFNPSTGIPYPCPQAPYTCSKQEIETTAPPQLSTWFRSSDHDLPALGQVSFSELPAGY